MERLFFRKMLSIWHSLKPAMDNANLHAYPLFHSENAAQKNAFISVFLKGENEYGVF